MPTPAIYFLPIMQKITQPHCRRYGNCDGSETGSPPAGIAADVYRSIPSPNDRLKARGSGHAPLFPQEEQTQ
jgi:hypothetical protein